MSSAHPMFRFFTYIGDREHRPTCLDPNCDLEIVAPSRKPICSDEGEEIQDAKAQHNRYCVAYARCRTCKACGYSYR
jgi:hypothetical protein